ncbi:MAG: NAD-dependent epimerase/dehydratase family protein [Candidatus Eisenbacteria bacterium]
MKHRIFVTGASGYIGSAVAARLVRAGHDVQGLARSEAAAQKLQAMGVTPVPGHLTDFHEWVGVLQNCDTAVHAAADMANGPSEGDQQALEAFRAASLDGRLRKVIYTSGIWVHGPGGDRVADETSPLRPLELVQWRVAHEEIALDLAAHDVATVILRPGMVYGEGRGLFGAWFNEAREKKTLTYPDGSQYWAMVHRDDVAEAYALAIEHGKGGERYLLADESRHTVKQIAEAAAAAAGAKAVSLPADDVVRHMGLFGKALLNSLQVTSAKARRELGWVPRHTSFVNEAPALWREWLDAKEAPVA